MERDPGAPRRRPEQTSEDAGDGGRRLLLVAAAEFAGSELREALRQRTENAQSEIRVVAPALTDSRLNHVAGNVDDAMERAQARLERSLTELRRAGFEANGQIGDADLRLAIDDAISTFPADEILLIAHADDPPPLEPQGIQEAERTFEPPITEFYVTGDGGGEPHVADIRRTEPGLEAEDSGERQPHSRNLPPYSVRDVAGIAVAIIGTGILVVLAANCGGEGSLNTTGGFDEGGGGFDGCAMRILIAGGLALLNVAHVVGLVLFQAGPYRGFWRDFFADLSLYGTPLAIVASALIE